MWSICMLWFQLWVCCIWLFLFLKRCNGLSYTMNYVDKVQKADEVVEANGTVPYVAWLCRSFRGVWRFILRIAGVQVFIDPKAVMYLVGCRMDFVVSSFLVSSLFSSNRARVKVTREITASFKLSPSCVSQAEAFHTAGGWRQSRIRLWESECEGLLRLRRKLQCVMSKELSTYKITRNQSDLLD